MFKKVAFIILLPNAMTYSMVLTEQEACSLLSDEQRSNPDAVKTITSFSPAQSKLLGGLIKNELQSVISFYREYSAAHSAAQKPFAALAANIVRCHKIMKTEMIPIFIFQLRNIVAIEPSFKQIIDEAFTEMAVETVLIGDLKLLELVMSNEIPIPQISLSFRNDSGAYPLLAAAFKRGYIDTLIRLLQSETKL
jgi:hypothetical protein